MTNNCPMQGMEDDWQEELTPDEQVAKRAATAHRKVRLAVQAV